MSVVSHCHLALPTSRPHAEPPTLLCPWVSGRHTQHVEEVASNLPFLCFFYAWNVQSLVFISEHPLITQNAQVAAHFVVFDFLLVFLLSTPKRYSPSSYDRIHNATLPHPEMKNFPWGTCMGGTQYALKILMSYKRKKSEESDDRENKWWNGRIVCLY